MKRSAGALASLDGGLLTSVGLLLAIGVVMLYSTTAPLSLGHPIPPHFARQLGACVVALLLAGAAAVLPLSLWRRAALPLWGLSVGLLLLTDLFAPEVNGARRWLSIPGLGTSFQPGELAKLTTLLAVSAALADARGRGRLSPRGLMRPVLLIAAPALLLVRQPDLGGGVVLVLLGGLLVFVAGVPLRLLGLAGAAGAAVVGLFVALNPYALRRVTGFLDPWARASDEGFQLVQSFVAFGSGGLLGRGLGDGRQKLFYLPEAHTDFILSVVAEEIGLLGVLLVLGGFAALLVAGLRIAGRARDPFAVLTGFAMTMLLTVPAAVNAGVVMGVLPTKGLALPFLSYGRTSLLVSFLAVGVLLGIGRAGARPRRAARAWIAWRRRGPR
ncbi:MAG: FtsW/RodA/SpoVE family cell cycle protein [Myxococcota bacterium]